jgi:colanic acid biosynthesis glycosyl transferase WcaI
VPSKFYGIAAAGRATIAVMDPLGEIPELINRSKSGLVVRVDDSRELADLLLSMASNPALAAEWGKNARTMIEHEFSRAQAMEKWRDLISALDPKPIDQMIRADPLSKVRVTCPRKTGPREAGKF